MPFGDHLEELRKRMILAIVGLMVGTILSLVFARRVLEIVYAPLLAALDAHGLEPSLLAVDVSGPFVSYLKMGFLCGLILSLPWIVHQAWAFISSGLYHHEQRFFRLFGPLAAILFATGVLFFYFVVLPIVLNFFISFNAKFGTPDLRGGLAERLADEDAEGEAASQPASAPAADVFRVPVYRKDPAQPPEGAVWINETEHRLRDRKSVV